MRFTKDTIAKILAKNEGIEATTSYTSRNFRETNHYKISDGKLLRRSTGKTSWADSRFDNTEICDLEQTRRFLKRFIYKLDLDGIE